MLAYTNTHPDTFKSLNEYIQNCFVLKLLYVNEEECTHPRACMHTRTRDYAAPRLSPSPVQVTLALPLSISNLFAHSHLLLTFCTHPHLRACSPACPATQPLGMRRCALAHAPCRRASLLRTRLLRSRGLCSPRHHLAPALRASNPRCAGRVLRVGVRAWRAHTRGCLLCFDELVPCEHMRCTRVCVVCVFRGGGGGKGS